MASTSGESPDTTALDEATVPDYEQRLSELLGLPNGPHAYQYLLGIIAILDDIEEPPLSATLRAYIRDEGINPKLVVADGEGGFITAYDNEHASRLRERVKLARREQLFEQVTDIGAAILRAPQ